MATSKADTAWAAKATRNLNMCRKLVAKSNTTKYQLAEVLTECVKEEYFKQEGFSSFPDWVTNEGWNNQYISRLMLGYERVRAISGSDDIDHTRTDPELLYKARHNLKTKKDLQKAVDDAEELTWRDFEKKWGKPSQAEDDGDEGDSGGTTSGSAGADDEYEGYEDDDDGDDVDVESSPRPIIEEQAEVVLSWDEDQIVEYFEHLADQLGKGILTVDFMMRVIVGMTPGEVGNLLERVGTVPNVQITTKAICGFLPHLDDEGIATVVDKLTEIEDKRAAG